MNLDNKIPGVAIWYIVSGISAILLFCFLSYGKEAKEPPKLKVGDTAPTFALRDLSGNYVKLSTFCGPWPKGSKDKRNIIILDFFATWCKPCIPEISILERIHKKYKNKGLKIFLVSIDAKGEDVVKPFVKKRKISLPVLLDMYKVTADRYGVKGIPHLFIVGKDGKIKAIYVGKEKRLKKKLTRNIEKLIKER